MVPDAHLSESPSLVVYKDKLYCFYQGPDHYGTLWYTTYGGNSWAAIKKVDSMLLSSNPSAVATKGKLYMLHRAGGEGHAMICNYFDGQTWSGDHDFVASQLGGNPDAAVHHEVIYAFRRGGIHGEDELWPPQDLGVCTIHNRAHPCSVPPEDESLRQCISSSPVPPSSWTSSGSLS